MDAEEKSHMNAKSVSVLSSKARRERNREEMKAAILSAARDIIRADGAAALSLGEVARRVGLQTPSLYAYFESKSAVYDALFRLGVHIYSERLEQIYQQHGPGWASIEATFHATMQFAYEYPELYQIVFERPVPGFAPSEEALAASIQMYERGCALMGQTIEQGHIQTDLSTEQTVNLLIAFMHGLTAQHLANEPHLAPGSGRFGSLLPAAVAILKAAWAPKNEDVS
jgi:AcrR family transcriptional regulator